MFKVVGLLEKREDLSTAEFQAHWRGTHAEIARRLPGLRRYTINFIDRAEFPGAAYDGFSELWFDSREAYEAAFFNSPVGAEIWADIPKFMRKLTRVLPEEHEIVKES